LSAKLVPTFKDKGCHVVSVTDPYGELCRSDIFEPKEVVHSPVDRCSLMSASYEWSWTDKFRKSLRRVTTVKKADFPLCHLRSYLASRNVATSTAEQIYVPTFGRDITCTCRNKMPFLQVGSFIQ
jgi:hypothetical protein